MTNPVTNPIPEHDPELVLYRFYDAEGGLIYVGKSVAFLDRLSQHRRDSGFFPLVASVTLERGFSTEGDLLAAEHAAIAAEHPQFNQRKDANVGGRRRNGRTTVLVPIKMTEVGRQRFKEAAVKRGMTYAELIDDLLDKYDVDNPE